MADEPLARALTEALQDVHARQRNVGLAAAVSRNGERLFSDHLGFADLERRVPVTARTRFAVASVTKAFTGAALVKLAERGRIELDAPIQRYVPGFPAKTGGTITPRLLAAHLAGVRHYRDGERTPEFLATHFDDIRDALRLFRDDPPLSAPGSRYSYSSYGYNLLAAAIQAAAGRPFPQYVREAILEPLGLADTQFDDARRPALDRARGYSYYDLATSAERERPILVPEWDYSYNMGGGNMSSTPEDLVRFGQAFVRPGFFSREALALFYTPQRTPVAESPWSFGWFVTTEAEDGGGATRRLHITGAFPGVQAALYVYPDRQVVVAITANTWGVGSRSGEMVSELPRRLAALCCGQ